MSGIERITAEIQKEASEKADLILSEARAKAAEAKAKAEADAAALVKASVDRAENEAEAMRGRAGSQTDLVRRQAVLKARQDVIGGVIRKAYDTLDQLPDDRYFEMLSSLLRKNAQPLDGELCLSARDLARMPESFAEKAASIAKECGGTLRVSKEAAPVENGFVLRYGGIEENCSLKAIFAAQRENMQDLVHRSLW